MKNSFVSLYREFGELIKTGTVDQAREFLIHHVSEFPEDVKNGIIFALFEDAVNEQAERDSAMSELKKEGIERINILERAVRILDDKLKVMDLQEKL